MVRIKKWVILSATWMIIISGCSVRNPLPYGESKHPDSPVADSSDTIEGGEARNPDYSPLLPPEAWEIAMGFLNAAFDAEAQLEEGDFSRWFALETEEGWEANALYRLYRSCLIKTRRMRSQDLSLAGWRYGLTCISVEEKDEGEIRALFQEDSVRTFALAPEIAAGSRELHWMTLISTTDGWKLKEYLGEQDLSNAMAEDYARRKKVMEKTGPVNREQLTSLLQTMEAEYLAQALEDVKIFEEGLVQRNTQTECWEGPDPDCPYIREKALDYARAWAWGGAAVLRSPDWPDYEAYGGDCQNFVSQCLLAGGIPMDWQGGFQWKWFGHTPNLWQEARGRSPAWSGVREFYAYCAGNSGSGLAARTDIPLGGLLPGDVVQFSALENWRHSALVTGEILDADGVRKDLLVASHCPDRENWPLSAYGYSRVRGIHIRGWNQ